MSWRIKIKPFHNIGYLFSQLSKVQNKNKFSNLLVLGILLGVFLSAEEPLGLDGAER